MEFTIHVPTPSKESILAYLDAHYEAVEVASYPARTIYHNKGDSNIITFYRVYPYLTPNEREEIMEQIAHLEGCSLLDVYGHLDQSDETKAFVQAVKAMEERFHV